MLEKHRVSRRSVLTAGIGIGAVAAGFARRGGAVNQDSAGISGPLPDTEGKGILVWKVTGLGYAAEEYFLSGRANVYHPVSMADAPDVASRDNTKDLGRREFSRELMSADLPFTTRLIIYRPMDKSRFSGNVILETLHPNGGGSSLTWNALHDFFSANGDVYVGVQHPLTFTGLKAADNARYGALAAAGPTQLWGMLTLAGAAVKSQGRGSALRGLEVKRLLMTGYSYTGVATATFANYHHHDARLANGRRIFDGYLPMADAQYVRPLDVPVLRLNTQSDFNGFGGLHNRRPNDDRYRHYEIAGAAHVAVPAPPDAALPPPPGQVGTPAGQPRFSASSCQATFPTGSRPNDFPLYLVQAAMFRNMFHWMESGRAPPAAELIETDESGKTRLDEFGNATGGVRFPQVAVPVASYGVGSTDACILFGYTAPFDAARCRSLYGDSDKYLAKVQACVNRLVAEQLLLPKDAAALVNISRAGAGF